jgi:NADPH-dependent 7-cyano-7-deazaguanine reductase QueF-like protein
MKPSHRLLLLVGVAVILFVGGAAILAGVGTLLYLKGYDVWNNPVVSWLESTQTAPTVSPGEAHVTDNRNM